jgi:hypothetical protein
VPKKVQFTQERVEYKVFLANDPLKGSKSLKIFKINLTFRFDKLSHLSKSVHKGEDSQTLTVTNKRVIFFKSAVKVLSNCYEELRKIANSAFRNVGWQRRAIQGYRRCQCANCRLR